jgi:hypothetical protein
VTTTIPAQTGTTAAVDNEIQIIRTPPTSEDARLILQLNDSYLSSGGDRGLALLHMFETPPTLAQVRKRHAPGSEEYRFITNFLFSCETLGTFVKHGLLNEMLVLDLYAISGAWQRSEKLIKGMRREAGEPRLMENFEWLAQRET